MWSFQHQAVVPVSGVAAFMTRLQAQAGMGARALEFDILPGARSGEVRCAVWSEIGIDKALWTAAAKRMKAGFEHCVPLNVPAPNLLGKLQASMCNQTSELIFPGTRSPSSHMSLTAVPRRMRVPATAHGFRSSFRDWAAELTAYPNEVAERALAHAVSDKVEAACRRGDLFDERVAVMADWAQLLGG